MFSYGNGGSQADRKYEKLALIIDDENQYAKTVSIGKSSMQYSLLESAKKVYTGFVYDHGNSMTTEVGRTFVGLRDDDGDRKCEVILLLVVHGPRPTKGKPYVGLTHEKAREILSDEFSCSLNNIITFDGIRDLLYTLYDEEDISKYYAGDLISKFFTLRKRRGLSIFFHYSHR